MENRSTSVGLTGIGFVVVAIGIAFPAPSAAPPLDPRAVVAAVAPVKESDIVYDDAEKAVVGFDRGRRLIADYVGRSWGAIESDSVNERNPRVGLRVTIATIPDPYDSHMDWSYDANVEALRRAMGTADYVPQSFWLPSRGDSVRVTTNGVIVRYAAHDFFPGVYLFRSIDSDNPSVHLVYLVSEMPTSGVHLQAFRAAVAERASIMRDGRGIFAVNARERAELSVLGPNFSGSASSLHALIDQALVPAGAPATSGDDSPRTARIVSGSATAFSNLRVLSDRGCTTVPRRDSTSVSVNVARIRFSATVNPDGALDEELNTVIKALGVQPFQVALLAEAGTAYGWARLDTVTAHVADPTVETARACSDRELPVGDPQSGQGPAPAVEPRSAVRDSGGSYLTVPFPLNIASLRGEFERSPASASAVPGMPRLTESPRTRLSLDEASRSRETPMLTSNLSVPSLDVVLQGIMRTLNEHDTRVVVIKATDVRDKLFLARELRRWVRDVVIVIYEGHVLLRRPEYADALRGALVLSSYPMLQENQYWSSSHRVGNLDSTYVRLDQLLAFPSDAATGVYNATLTLLGRPWLRTEFALHNALDHDSAYELPPVWLSVIGRDGFYPLRASVPSARWRSYLGVPQRDTEPASSTTGRLHEHSFTHNGPLLSGIIITPAFLILALLVMFLVGRPTLSRLGLVVPTALGRPASATETLYLALFVLSLSATYLPFSVAVDARRIVASVDPYAGGLSIAMWGVLFLSAIVLLSGLFLLLNGIAGLVLASRPAIQRATGDAMQRARTPERSVPTTTVSAAASARRSFRERVVAELRTMRSMPLLNAGTIEAVGVDELDEYPQQTTRYELPAVRLVGLAGIVIACMLFIGSSLAYTWHLVWMSRHGGIEATFSMYRALHITSGVSPLLPLVLLGAGVAIWTWWQLQQVRQFDSTDHFENGVRALAHADLAAALWRRAYRAMVDARRGLSWIAPGFGVIGILLVLGLMCWFVASRRIPSLELLADTADGADRWFDLALWIGIASLLLSTSWAIYRLAFAWNGMERFLDIVGGSPLACAFARLPLDVARLTDVGFLGFRRDERNDSLYAEEQWLTARADVKAATASVQATAQGLGVVLCACVTKASSEPRGERSVRCALETLREAWELARTRPDPVKEVPIEPDAGDASQVRAMRSLEEYVACEIVLYVDQYLQNLRRLCFFLFAALLILVTVSAQYPYEPHTVVSLSAVILLVMSVVAVFFTMVRMSRNVTLSRISHTESGRVTWNTTFVLNLVTFGVVPLLALVSSEFPEVRAFLFSWAEPMVRAVAKG